MITIVILSYARPALLARALASVTAQAYPNLEILLVDNKSAASGEIARVAGNFPAVRLIQNSDNLGFAGGMNVGIAAASGDVRLPHGR